MTKIIPEFLTSQLTPKTQICPICKSQLQKETYEVTVYTECHLCSDWMGVGDHGCGCDGSCRRSHVETIPCIRCLACNQCAKCHQQMEKYCEKCHICKTCGNMDQYLETLCEQCRTCKHCGKDHRRRDDGRFYMECQNCHKCAIQQKMGPYDKYCFECQTCLNCRKTAIQQKMDPSDEYCAECCTCVSCGRRNRTPNYIENGKCWKCRKLGHPPPPESAIKTAWDALPLTTRLQYQSMEKLRDFAREYHIGGFSRMKKEELITILCTTVPSIPLEIPSKFRTQQEKIIVPLP